MKYFIVFFILISSPFFFASDTDLLLKKHPLLGKVVSTHDFTLVVSNINSTYSLSPKIKKINASLLTLDDRFSTVSFPSNGMNISNILPPETKLTIIQVYRHKSSFFKSLFVTDTSFAIVTDNIGKKYSMNIFQNKVHLETNGCKYKTCLNWRRPLVSMMHSKKSKHRIHLEYFLQDTEGVHLLSNKFSPPYPRGMLKRSRQNLIDYLVQRNIYIIDKSESHPFVSILVDYLEYGNLIINYEQLGIRSVSALM